MVLSADITASKLLLITHNPTHALAGSAREIHAPTFRTKETLAWMKKEIQEVEVYATTAPETGRGSGRLEGCL